MAMGKKVFISYCHAQMDWVREKLAVVLQAGGAEPLVDYERFKAGKTVIGQMDTVQDCADMCMLVLSPDYLASGYCLHEMERALSKDPSFSEGKTIPLLRKECTLLAPLTGPTGPLWIDLRDDGNAASWQLAMQACGADLGCPPPAWLAARDTIRTNFDRRLSFNLLTHAKARWKELVCHLREDFYPDMVMIDLDCGQTSTRRTLIRFILGEIGIHTDIPESPGEDLALLDKHIKSRSFSRLFFCHFDLVKSRAANGYDIDFFSAIRYLAENRMLCVGIQSKTGLASLLPSNHPVSSMLNIIRTVEL